MPNHIQSQVEIKGTKEAIDKLVKGLKLKRDNNADSNEFDFNAIIKMPPSLMITSGSDVNLGLVALGESPSGIAFNSFESYLKMPWWKEQYPGIDTREKLLAHLRETRPEAIKEAEQARDNLKKYGHKDWYNWSNANWGTKWNAYDVRYITGNDTTIVVEISTAWDTPRQIWDALREQGFEVNGFYYGEMEGYDEIGAQAWDRFTAYQNVEIEYNGA